MTKKALISFQAPQQPKKPTRNIKVPAAIRRTMEEDTSSSTFTWSLTSGKRVRRFARPSSSYLTNRQTDSKAAPAICRIEIHNGYSLQWRHDDRDGVSSHQPHDCLLNRLFRHRSKETSKFRVNRLCEGNSPVTRKMFPFDDVIMDLDLLRWHGPHSYQGPLLLIWISFNPSTGK